MNYTFSTKVLTVHFDFSGNPDNALGNESYAIMDVSRAGHWLDVNNEGSYPFVCSRYKTKCPSVAKFFNNSASMF